MRSKFALFMLLVLGPVVAAQQPARPPAPASAQKLPPLVYVCTMAGDEDVLEDKPGNCPKCNMKLQPVRLDSKFWCPTHQSLVVRDAAGKCPMDGRDLVQVTLAVTWTCADKPNDPFTDPGKCADGKDRKINYAIRAHGDHNPKHGGQFFMAEDAWHHIEGTYPSAGLFRVYFYDNFTKPMAARAFTGSLVLLDASFKETASFPLRLGANGQTMEARIPAAQAALPLNAAAKIKFGGNLKEQMFNFPFQKYTVEPAAPAPAPAATRATPAAAPAAGASTANGAARPSGAATAARPAPQPAQAAPPAVAAAPPLAPPAAAPAAQAPLILDSPLNMPPGLAEATDESRLPSDNAGLLAELESRAKEVEALVNEGALAQVWLPAMGTKTVALVLDQRSGNLPERQRTAIAAAVKEIVLASWEIDSYGDLGNRQKITEAYARLKAALTNLRSQYAQ